MTESRELFSDSFQGEHKPGEPLTWIKCTALRGGLDEPGRRSVGKLLTKDEARRIAANIAKLA